MAASGSDTNTEEAFLISPRRKVEIFGLVLMVFALLVSLAFASYHPDDAVVLRSADWSEVVLNPQSAQADRPVQNVLGLLGAQLAEAFVPGFIGYGVLLISGLLMVWGYAVFRHASLRRLLYPSLLTAFSAFILSCVVGWVHHTVDAPLRAWAGLVGIGTAGWMQNVFGEVGSFILLLLAGAVLLLLVVDHDIQRTVDRVIRAARRIGAGVSAAGAYIRDQWSRARAHAPEPKATAPASDPSSSASASGSPSASSPGPPSSPPAEESTSSPPPARTRPEDSGAQTPSVRRNDLFRPGRDPAPSATDDNTVSPEPAPDSSARTSDADPPEDDAPKDIPDETTASTPAEESPATDSPPPPNPPPPPADENASSDESAAPAPDEPPPDAPDGPDDDVSMTIQEQVEEETTDEIERTAELPDDFEYEPPSLDLLDKSVDTDPTINREELEENKRVLLDKLDMYNIEIEEINAVVGPTVTRYELTPAPGIKVSRIKSLEDDLAMAMAAPGIRMIAPIPGKSAVGVEIPNRNRELVRLRDVIGTRKFQDTDLKLPLPLGKNIEGEVHVGDLAKMPHLLIAGATGSGKSVGLNSIITGLIYACHPANLRFVIIDPKKIELQQYTALETQFVAVPEDIDQTVITDIDEASGVLKSVEREMETRYDLLSDASVRNITGYNEKFQAGELDPTEGHRHMPYLVVVVDELADLMMAAGDDVEGPISRLAQMARAVGIHLILATQRPSVDVVTGVIKANFPSRIAFEVASRVDSRTILDQGGAEDLVGNGDMLFLSGSDLKRLQGPFVSVEEVEEVVDYVADQPGVTPYTLPSLQDAGHGPDETLGVEDTDEKFEEAARVIVRRQQGSVSLLQRKLAVGYTRAARIVDQLEEAGIVGPFNGTKARDVLVDDEQALDDLLHGEDADEADPEEA
ncbi:S-DNA-T family DNA segregation ATPase FtsK/SpoIIIE [Salinibacter ruber]|uniref:S-DNA-T family DNA segregation ATPase FtsK/SpoIIIE n=1 Tax=Salinibacter ruber TaxID=146919 RepID=A0A9X2TDE1_9BACT|nr:DNA translocase FtsK [Salinibacter ruber]MCS3676934.1 S-DNA-T family DNA segregation ATPase FtsK/SpoIIIE [Salinibacter ruber]MCS3680222.1 S-DNA-T family DNA segregation ATPase FtsK/SpoIIIE [Salinibacter ruber]